MLFQHQFVVTLTSLPQGDGQICFPCAAGVVEASFGSTALSPTIEFCVCRSVCLIEVVCSFHGRSTFVHFVEVHGAYYIAHHA